MTPPLFSASASPLCFTRLPFDYSHAMSTIYTKTIRVATTYFEFGAANDAPECRNPGFRSAPHMGMIYRDQPVHDRSIIARGIGREERRASRLPA